MTMTLAGGGQLATRMHDVSATYAVSGMSDARGYKVKVKDVDCTCLRKKLD
jgi:hypothetical protein